MKTVNRTITVKEVVNASKKYVSNESVRLVLADGTSFGLTAKVVSQLPQTGENGILYLIPRESTTEGNIYDEYLWVMKEDETFGFEKIGATEVSVTLYDGPGQNTDGAMTQKAVTDALKDLSTRVLTEEEYNEMWEQ